MASSSYISARTPLPEDPRGGPRRAQEEIWKVLAAAVLFLCFVASYCRMIGNIFIVVIMPRFDNSNYLAF